MKNKMRRADIRRARVASSTEILFRIRKIKEKNVLINTNYYTRKINEYDADIVWSNTRYEILEEEKKFVQTHASTTDFTRASFFFFFFFGYS